MMEFVNGKDDNPYMKWKIKGMLKTTNQYNTHLYQNIIEHKLWKIKFMFETTNRICVPIPMIGLMGKLSKL